MIVPSCSLSLIIIIDTMTRLMLKKELILYIWIGVIFLFPVILHVGFNYIQIIPTIEELSSSVWLSFWGSYLGGIATMLAVYFTIKRTSTVNQNSLNRQWEEKKYLEYKKMLLANMEIFNIVDIKKFTSYITADNVDIKVVELIHKRQLMYSCDLTFRIISEIEVVDKNHLESEINYHNYWRIIYKELSDIMDLQDRFLTDYKIQEHRNWKMESLMKSKAYLEQLVAVSHVENEQNEYSAQLSEILTEQKVIDVERKLYHGSFDTKLNAINELCDKLQQSSCSLYSLTLKLLKQKELGFTKQQ